MKRIFIALMVAMTFCSLAMAQNQTITQTTMTLQTLPSLLNTRTLWTAVP